MSSEIDIPAKSSGENWTAYEDELLYGLIIQLVGRFKGRSLAAVMSRINRNQIAYSRRHEAHLKKNHKLPK